MTCPVCGSSKHTVYDTLPALCEFIFRKRKCLECGYHFKTAEVELPDDDKSVKYAFYEAEKMKHSNRKKNMEDRE